MKINKKKTTFIIFIVFAIIGFGYYIYKNPQLLNNIHIFQAQSTNKADKINSLQNQINVLSQKIAQIPNFETKADKAHIINLEEKIIDINQRLNNISKKTNTNALILTASIMLRQEALSGNSIKSQTYLLENLSKNEPQLQTEINIIKNTPNQQVLSDEMIIADFNNFYQDAIAQQKADFERTQKSSIKTKLDNFIKIKKVNKTNPDFMPNQELETIKKLVYNKNFSQAVINMQKIKPDTLYINEKLNDWQHNIKTRENLLNAINAIIAKSIIAIDIKQENKE